MLNEEELTALLSDLESDRVERTASLSKDEKFREAVCAFANDFPNHQKCGYLLIGVKDDGALAGMQVTDQLLQTLGGIRSDGNILPQPAIHIYKKSLQGGDVAIVEVRPSDAPPVRYKGRTYIRVGPRQAIANEQEERILTERRLAKSPGTFDMRPCTEARLDDLALGQFDSYRHTVIDPDIIAANHRSIEQQLASLRFYHTKHACPTYAGILLFGKNPRFFMPGAYIQYLKFSSLDLNDTPEDQAEISGDLYSILRELEGRLKLLINTTMRPISPLQEKLFPNYPEWALRELLMNAVMHRDYESNTPIRFYAFPDRIEIQNPGGLYGETTSKNFPQQNSYRNPVVAEAMKSLGFVNRFGHGVERAQELLKQNHNPPAAFTLDDSRWVSVKVYRRQE